VPNRLSVAIGIWILPRNSSQKLVSQRPRHSTCRHVVDCASGDCKAYQYGNAKAVDSNAALVNWIHAQIPPKQVACPQKTLAALTDTI